MKSIVIFMLFCLTACSNSNQNLTIDMLAFYNLERAAIKRNNIYESEITYDSLELLKNPYKSAQFERFLQFCKDGIGTEIVKYDSNGNIVEINTHEFMGTYQRFKYDSLNLLTEKIYDTDFSAHFSSKNSFDINKMTLYQIWSYGDEIDTTIFMFNKKVKIESESGYMHDDHYGSKRRYIKKFIYSDKNLIKIETKWFNFRTLIESTEVLKYKDNQLVRIDKVNIYKHIDSLGRPQIISEQRDFDKLGLPIRITESYSNNNKIYKLIKNRTTETGSSRNKISK